LIHASTHLAEELEARRASARRAPGFTLHHFFAVAKREGLLRFTNYSVANFPHHHVARVVPDRLIDAIREESISLVVPNVAAYLRKQALALSQVGSEVMNAGLQLCDRFSFVHL
jgi:hypothetical protein